MAAERPTALNDPMSARSLLTFSLVAAGILVPAANADAAAKKATGYPTIAKIAPMRAAIGETMTITGKGFLRGKAKNTVVFRRDGKRSVFIKADGLSTTKLSFVLPDKLAASLGKQNGTVIGTRFRIRVLAKRFGKTYTSLKSSPLVLPRDESPVTAPKAGATAPAPVGVAAVTPLTAVAATAVPPSDCDADGQIDDVDFDDDNDLLLDTTEALIQTNRCLSDSDGDGMEDGWEYQSAIDLNRPSCPAASAPYPVPCAVVLPGPYQLPYPNPRFMDADVDYDGDWMYAGEEHAGWKHKISRDASYRTLVNMWYSDGKQASVDTSPSTTCVGMTVPDPFDGTMVRPEFRRENGTYPTLYSSPGVVDAKYRIYSLDRGSRHAGNGCLDDGERDEDGDFLTNVEESHAQLWDDGWWLTVMEEPMFRLSYSGTDWLRPDADGDGTIDGLDDQDFDDFLNVEELRRGLPARNDANADTGVRTGLWVQAFNPCLPAIESRTCPTALPAGEPGAWRPWYDGEATGPRWPLYRDWLHNPRDTDPAAPDPATAPDLTSPELWDPPAGVDQNQLPPEHPLPRD
jgi:hypothetical protein